MLILSPMCPTPGSGDNVWLTWGSLMLATARGGRTGLFGDVSAGKGEQALELVAPRAQPSPQIRKLFQNNACGNLSICHLFLIVLFFSASWGLFSSFFPVTMRARSSQLLLY